MPKMKPEHIEAFLEGVRKLVLAANDVQVSYEIGSTRHENWETMVYDSERNGSATIVIKLDGGAHDDEGPVRMAKRQGAEAMNEQRITEAELLALDPGPGPDTADHSGFPYDEAHRLVAEVRRLRGIIASFVPVGSSRPLSYFEPLDNALQAEARAIREEGMAPTAPARHEARDERPEFSVGPIYGVPHFISGLKGKATRVYVDGKPFVPEQGRG